MINKILQSYKYILYSLKLKYKLLISYFILIIITLTVFMYFTYRNIAQSTEAQSRSSANLLLDQTCSFLNYKMSYIEYITEQIAFDNTLGNILKKDENAPISPSLMEDYFTASSIVKRFYKDDTMYSIGIYINNNIYYSNSQNDGIKDSYFTNLNLIKEDNWYKQLDKFNGKLLWLTQKDIYNKTNNSTNIISGVRFLKHDFGGGDYTNIGVIKVSLSLDDMNNLVKKANTYKKGVVYIVNSKGDLVSTSSKANYNILKIPTSTLTNIISNKNNESILNVNMEKVMVGAQHINETDWTLVSVIPYKELFSSINKTKYEMISLMLIIASLAYILAYYISNSITKRIRSLIKRMKRVQNGELSTIISVKGTDELSELVENYNYMIDKMTEHSKLQYELGQSVKNAELNALQAQINPHFLYNTLELIHWTALRKNAPEISDIVQSLAKFYKLSLSKGKNIISIKDELEHVEIYVKLQNYRFKNCITLIMDIDENILSYTTIKLILQPIVENSILHGILSKPDKSGTIRIIGTLIESSIIFSIEDNGIGIPQEQLEDILDNSDSKQLQGYGVKNVNNRIKLHYGNQYGLSYTSVLGVGTIVKFQLPAIIE